MTLQEANKIKKILKKENAVFTCTAGYYDGSVLRVKVAEFCVNSKLAEIKITEETKKQREKEAIANMCKVLRALERNGLRPEYDKEQRETNNDFGKWDCRYLIFK